MTATLTLEAIDLTGTRATRIRQFPAGHTVDELVSTAVSRMGLGDTDATGRPVSYMARHETTGAALFPSETVGSVLRTGDRFRLAPNIQAGR